MIQQSSSGYKLNIRDIYSEELINVLPSNKKNPDSISLKDFLI